jgi:dihydroorotase-like cyclic amidohydrolase
MSIRADLLIHGARLVTAGSEFAADIAICDGCFAWIGPAGEFGGVCAERFEADGLTALPGLIDAHVHCRAPGAHAYKADYASESRAAAAGGVTTMLTMPNTVPHTSTVEVLAAVRAAAQASLIDYGLQFMIKPDNLDQILAARGVAAFKLYLDPTTGVDNPLAGEEVLRPVLRTGVMLTAHAEGDTLDHLLDCHRRWGAGPLYICHVSLKREVESLRRAKQSGQWVYGEATPHHLLLDNSDFARLGAYADMRPTLKPAADVAALWQGLADGTIDTIATDHAPHTHEDKQRTPPPPGVPGLQTMLPLLLTAVSEGRLSWRDLVRLTSRNPAAIFGLAGKGLVRVGADADLTLVDPAQRHVISDGEQLTKPGWTPFAGRGVMGAVVGTLRRGQWVWREGVAARGAGGQEVLVR